MVGGKPSTRRRLRSWCCHHIEPWWKARRSLALQGKRFETWGEIEQALVEATRYWNAHRHPFVWGRRRHQRVPRRAGLVALPKVA